MTSHSTRSRGAGLALAIGAIGVVFGDIGTSPLYSMQTVFAIDDHAVRVTPDDVYGIVSLAFWAIMVIVSVKYVLLIMRADNDGEGGVMALAHLANQAVPRGGRRFRLVMVLGVLGAALFYGDSVITPAISVLSAVEGLKIADPGLAQLVLPIGGTIIAALFAIQRFGTKAVGRLFGPVMVLWFLTLAALGLPHVVADPAVVRALLPTYALGFVVAHPFIAFVAMGAVVLTITGAEALYADMGHFGRTPIRGAWFVLVLPCLVINYLGQAQQLLKDPSSADNPFFRLAPDWGMIPLVVLATIATVIASQAVISGAYSVSRQAERLGYLPRLTVRHTSEHSGQIYVPVVNWLLCAGVLLLLAAFQASERLAAAYGLAVTGTLLITTTLFLVYAAAAWHWPRWRLVLVGVVFGGFELQFFAANLTKLPHGGWLPIVIAAVVATMMFTWQRGRTLVSARRRSLEGDLDELLDEIRRQRPYRVAGKAVFLHPPTPRGESPSAPLALRENFNVNHVLHESVLIVTTTSLNVPHVPLEDRVIATSDLGETGDNIERIRLQFGFQDDQNVPEVLVWAASEGLIDFDPGEATYFLSRITLHIGPKRVMPMWRKRVFIGMAHNAANPAEYFRLPVQQVVVMGAQVNI